MSADGLWLVQIGIGNDPHVEFPVGCHVDADVEIQQGDLEIHRKWDNRGFSRRR